MVPSQHGACNMVPGARGFAPSSVAPLRSTHIHQRLCPQRKSGKYFVFITLLCLDIRKEGRIPLFGSGLTFSRPHDGLRGSGGWARFTPKPPGKCRLACRALWCRKKGLAVVSQTAARYRMESLRRLRKQVPQKTQSQWRSSNIELYAPRSPNPTCARIRIQRIYFGAEYAREYAYSLRPSTQ